MENDGPTAGGAVHASDMRHEYLYCDASVGRWLSYISTSNLMDSLVTPNNVAIRSRSDAALRLCAEVRVVSPTASSIPPLSFQKHHLDDLALARVEFESPMLGSLPRRDIRSLFQMFAPMNDHAH
jgi:hypothetical protein